MIKDIIIQILIVLILIGVFYYICYAINKDYEKCIDEEGHKWKFWSNSKGRTGDLGFGIKASWDVDRYICEKCGKEKEVEKY